MDRLLDDFRRRRSRGISNRSIFIQSLGFILSFSFCFGLLLPFLFILIFILLFIFTFLFILILILIYFFPFLFSASLKFSSNTSPVFSDSSALFVELKGLRHARIVSQSFSDNVPVSTTKRQPIKVKTNRYGISNHQLLVSRLYLIHSLANEGRESSADGLNT